MVILGTISLERFSVGGKGAGLDVLPSEEKEEEKVISFDLLASKCHSPKASRIYFFQPHIPFPTTKVLKLGVSKIVSFVLKVGREYGDYQRAGEGQE